MYFTRVAEQIGQLLQEKSLLLTTAESCTGGMVSAYLTAIPGSSAWFERGFVTYSNEAKIAMLGVNPHLIHANGAVSEAVALAMAKGALKHSLAHVSLSITGIAGPTGGSIEKPVGLVCFGFSQKNRTASTYTERFKGDRAAIREQACEFALENLLKLLMVR